MFFSVQDTLVAVVVASLATEAVAIPVVGEAGVILSRDPTQLLSYSHHIRYNHKTAIVLGRKLLKQAASLKDKSTWLEEKTVDDWTKHYGPAAEFNFQSGLLRHHDQRYLKDVLKQFNVDVTTTEFQKFVVFSKKEGNATHAYGNLREGGKGKEGSPTSEHKGEGNGKDDVKSTSTGSSPAITSSPSSKKKLTEHADPDPASDSGFDSGSDAGSETPKGKLAQLKDKLTGKYRKTHKHHLNKHPHLPVLVADYSDDVIIIKSIHHSHDHNKKKNMLHMYELLYQGAVQTNSTATAFVREAPRGTLIRKFIHMALKATTTGSLKANSTKRHELRAFEMLLGTPTGKAVEELCIHHAKYYGGKSVKEIQIKGPKGHESIIFIVS